MNSIPQSQSRLFIAGFAGLLGALLTGTGEGLMQLMPGADYTDLGYAYFAHISKDRLMAGHFLGIAAAPLYIAGYWHLTGNILAQRGQTRILFFGVCAYAFIVGTVWLGQRAFLGLTVQAIAADRADDALLVSFSAFNEPLVNVLRLTLFVFSVIWVHQIARGRTTYPRWMAILSPAAVLASIFAFYVAWPAAGSWLLPVALNVAHVIVFSASLLVLVRRPAT